MRYLELQNQSYASLIESVVNRAMMSDSFKSWFKNSVVVDDKGNPLPVYHGTDAIDFDTFYVLSHFGTHGASNERLDAFPDWIGTRVLPVFLSIQKPLMMGKEHNVAGLAWEHQGDMIWQIAEVLSKTHRQQAELMDDLIEDHEMMEWTASDPVILPTLVKAAKIIQQCGYDGLIYENAIEDAGSLSYVPLWPTQIKSAFNRGNWNKQDGRITEKRSR